MANKYFNLSRVSSGVIIPLLLVAEIGLGYFLVWPQLTRMNDGRVLLAAKQAEQYDLETSLSSIQKLLSDLESKRGRLSDIDEALPPSPDVPGLLANLEYLILQSGLALEDIQIQLPKGAPGEIEFEGQEKSAPEGAKTIMIEISAAGQYPQLFAFLLNMEQNLRLFDIQKIDLGTEGAETDTQSFVVGLKTYYQEPE